VKITGLGSIKVCVALSDDDDGLFLTKRLDKLDGALAPDRQWKNSVRKENGVAYGKDGQSTPLWTILALFGIARMDDTEKVASHECLFIRLYDLTTINLTI
jgi:hypothetical protein